MVALAELLRSDRRRTHVGGLPARIYTQGLRCRPIRGQLHLHLPSIEIAPPHEKQTCLLPRWGSIRRRVGMPARGFGFGGLACLGFGGLACFGFGGLACFGFGDGERETRSL